MLNLIVSSLSIALGIIIAEFIGFIIGFIILTNEAVVNWLYKRLTKTFESVLETSPDESEEEES